MLPTRVSRNHLLQSLVLIFLICACFAVRLPAQADDSVSPLSAQPRDRVAGFIDEERRLTLHGSTHPLATKQNDLGAIRPEFPMERMILTLSPDAEQQRALTRLAQAQHDPSSPFYHQWLTPEQYGERFGVSENDLAQVTRWLESHGMQLEEVPAGRNLIIFSGTEAKVQETFHSEIHRFLSGDEYHHANVKDAEIPEALASVVAGVVSLHDFRSHPAHSGVRKVDAQFSSGSSHYLTPADFATIYDIGPAYQQTLTGSGQTIAVLGRSNLKLTDVRQFRSLFGLPSNDPRILLNGPDPGIYDSGEETEADLDVEWSGAVARNATIDFVVSQSTNSTDGVYLSAQYAVNHNLASVITVSFGLCEAWVGTPGNAFLNSLWQQAAVQGISVFVSSGDSGAAGCDSASAPRAVNGLAVNGLCSTIYDTCVGGTEFNDAANPALYWASFNAAGTQASALGYIPEVAWNESGYGLWATGGGASAIYSKPWWQSGAGVPADARRDVPDVSLAAAGHDGYLVVQEGGLVVVGGTSAAAPSFAGLMAMVVQNANARQGNADTALYALAAKQASGGAAVFHDITSGNNTVPGQVGFNATRGYDRSTGLGSVDAWLLIHHWSDANLAPAFQLSSSSTSLSVSAGGSSTMTVNIMGSGGFNAAANLSVAGLPAGVSAGFRPARISGSGSSTLTLSALKTAKSGTYRATLVATSGALQKTARLNVTVRPKK